LLFVELQTAATVEEAAAAAAAACRYCARSYMLVAFQTLDDCSGG
jgi:hypothetical protein